MGEGMKLAINKLELAEEFVHRVQDECIVSIQRNPSVEQRVDRFEAMTRLWIEAQKQRDAAIRIATIRECEALCMSPATCCAAINESWDNGRRACRDVLRELSKLP